MMKYWKHAVAAFICLAVVIVITMNAESNREIVIEIGIYSGNEWGVPQIDVYKIYDEAIELFEEQYPGVKVIYRSGTLMEDYSEWLAQKMLLGDEPDVFIVLKEDFNTLAEVGMLESLTPFINESDDFELDDYYTKALEASSYDGEQFGMPFQIVPTFLAVNKTLLSENDLHIPSDDWTMEEHLEMCRALTMDTDNDNVMDQFGTVGYEWDVAYYALNGNFEDSDKAVHMYDEAILKEALDYTKAINNLNLGRVVSSYDFSQGNVGFKSFSLAEFRAYKPYPYKIKKYSNFDWGAISFPRSEGNISKAKLYTVQWGMSSRAKEKSMAWEFIRFMTNDHQVQQMVWDYTYALPTNVNVVNDIYANTDVSDSVLDPQFLKLVIEQSVVEPTFKNYNQIREVMDIRIKVNILEGRSTLEILRNIREDVDETIFTAF